MLAKRETIQYSSTVRTNACKLIQLKGNRTEKVSRALSMGIEERERDRQTESVSNLVFYAQSTSTVV